MTLKDKTAVVGLGFTEYYKRGQSVPETEESMASTAILRALDDAGLTIKDLDGFAIYSNSCNPAGLASLLGVPEIRFAASLTGGGNGSAGCVGLAAAAVESGIAECVVSLMTLQQATRRLGGTQVAGGGGGGGGGNPYGGGGIPPSMAFGAATGMGAPGHSFSMIARRHMHKYGTTREHLAAVCINQRNNAIKRPTSIRRDPLTMDEYFNARMVSDPLCLLDYTMESDGAVAVITTTAERAKDLKQKPVYIMATAIGGAGWNMGGFQMPDDADSPQSFASSGNRSVAKRVYEMAGIGPKDVDVALLYDHFSPMVLLQLEDYGFCPVGESGPFVADGNIRLDGGVIPVNTHGGHLSEAYIIGMTHVREAIEQMRGTSYTQVKDAEIALVTGGPSQTPHTATIFRRA